MTTSNLTRFILLKWRDPLNGAKVEGYFPLPLVIGRGDHADLPLRHESVSRKHVLIAMTSRGVIVRDLESHNGTLLNGKPMRFAALTAGDRIRIGAYQLHVVRIGAEAYIKTPIILSGGLNWQPDISTMGLRSL